MVQLFVIATKGFVITKKPNFNWSDNHRLKECWSGQCQLAGQPFRVKLQKRIKEILLPAELLPVTVHRRWTFFPEIFESIFVGIIGFS